MGLVSIGSIPFICKTAIVEIDAASARGIHAIPACGLAVLQPISKATQSFPSRDSDPVFADYLAFSIVPVCVMVVNLEILKVSWEDRRYEIGVSVAPAS
jgi:hypothetical protein